MICGSVQRVVKLKGGCHRAWCAVNFLFLCKGHWDPVKVKCICV